MAMHLILETLGTPYALPLEGVLSLSFVAQLSPPPETAPASVVGLINLRGNIFPVWDLAQRLGHPPPRYERDSTLIFVQSGQATAALLVQAVRDLIDIPASSMATTLHFQAEEHMAACFSGQARLPERVMPILDIKGLIGGTQPIAAEHAPTLDLSHLGKELLEARALNLAQTNAVDEQGLKHYLLIQVAGDPYAIELQDIRELTPLRGVRHLANSPAYIQGAMALRGEILMVINLTAWIRPHVHSENTHAVVVEVNNQRMALAVEQILGLSSFTPQQLSAINSDHGDNRKLCKAMAHNDQLTVGIIEPALLANPQQPQTESFSAL